MPAHSLQRGNKGFALVYVLLLMTLVIFLSSGLLELTLTDFKANVNIISKQQTYYNSEAGILDGLKRYDKLSYNGFNVAIYYLDLSEDKALFTLNKPVGSDYVKVKIYYVKQEKQKSYTIEATGYYKGCQNQIIKYFII